MKSKFALTLAIAMFTSTLSPTFTEAGVVKQNLDKDWKFRQARQGNWHDAKVPGEIHTDLMREGLIEDPFFGQNERKVQWVDKEDWIYETIFAPTPEMLQEENVNLIFKGLDTYADVYLNDSLILEADNMFREWEVPVKNLLKEDNNSLRILLHSPIKTDLPKLEKLGFKYEASNDQSENGGVFDKRVSVFARKAGYHYGWDWGPRLVTSGIWRPIILEGWSGLKIDDVFIETQKITPDNAEMKAVVSLENQHSDDKCRLELIDASSNKKLASKEYRLEKGINNLTLPFNITSPKLWWCNGLGEPNLYDIQCNVIVGKDVVAQTTVSTGVRTIEVVREKDPEGRSFFFKLNGVPVFAKGANYIPCDNFLSRVTKEVYEKTIQDAVDVNMNMLRVWGGGIYEDDYFYELCDKNGIMVWQDFMFACSLYPAEGEMLDNIKYEAIDNVKRLRDHPSIVLWCGNNECLDAWYGWGWKNRYTKQGVDSIIWDQYDNLFHKVLPEVVAEYSPKSFYWPSSPFSRYDGIAEANNGDFHLWTVWGQSKPIEDYNHIRSRFFSEYGFQSFPTLETVKTYAPDPDDWDINSEVMLSHQRGGEDANNRIKKYLDDAYPQPKDFESLLYMTQILQGDAIRTAIESHRRNKPYCMGSLFWQHNDCWPVASWSSRDYYGNWKAQHYYARKAFDDVLVSCIITGDSLNVYTVSDRQVPTEGYLSVDILTLKGDTIAHNIQKMELQPDAVNQCSFDVNTIIGSQEKSNLIIVAQYETIDGRTYETVSSFLKPKDMAYLSPNIDYTIEEDDGKKVLNISSDTYVKGVFLSLPGMDCTYSDNFFDLLPNRPVSVILNTQHNIDHLRQNLKMTNAYSSTHL